MDPRQLWRQEMLDPLPRRLLRLVRVAAKTRIVAQIDLARAPQALRVALARGLGVRTLHALHALQSPDRLAVVDAERSASYREFDREINRVAHGLAARFGVGRRTPFVLAADNRIEYVATWFALARLGARAIHASYRSRPGELEYLVRHSGARVLLVSDASLEAASTLATDRPELGMRLLVAGGAPASSGGSIRYDDLVAASTDATFPAPVGGEAETESVVYTSGTTGKPKGAVRDFAKFGAVELSRLLDRLPFAAGDRHLIVAPLYHSGAQAFTLIQSALGATIYLEPHFDPERTLVALSREAIHSCFLVPTMIRRIVELPDAVHERHPTPALRAIVSGAAELDQKLREAAIGRFGASALFDFYGATELGWVTLVDGREMLERPGSVGRALAGQQVRILDEQGRDVPPGDVGLVYVRNEQTMQGYLDDPVASRATQRGEWATVEDLGRLDADGHLYLAGRARDMVKSGGVNIYPVEIEEVLARHPNVAEVAVIGVPDAEWGERLVAVVVPRGELDPADVERWAREHLSSIKVPRRWEIVPELPRNATGKVPKKELRARYSQPPPS